MASAGGVNERCMHCIEDFDKIDEFPDMKETWASIPLYQPCLYEVKQVLQDALSKVFTEVSVNVVNCPDLRREPFHLAAQGLCGNAQALEMGKYCNQFSIDKNKMWSLQIIINKLYKGFCFVIGGGLRYGKSNSNEYIANFTYSGRHNIFDKSQIVLTNDAGMCRLTRNLELGCNCFGSFFVSKGYMIENVLEVRVKQRKANINFADVMHLALCKEYGQTRPVGLGGTFHVKNGIVKHDVMLKKFVPTNTCFYPYVSPLYDIQAPLVGIGTMYSFKSMFVRHACAGIGESTSIKEQYMFRGQRFYTFSPTGDGGGIYSNDCSPNTIEYHGYFNLANIVHCFNLPVVRVHLANADIKLLHCRNETE